MLQNIRDRFTGVMALIIIGGIGVAMVIGLVNTETGMQGRESAASVNGEEIALTDYREVVQQQVLQQEQQTRSDIPPAERAQIDRNVLEGMVRNRVVAQYVKAQGFRVGDARVAEQIRTLPVFQVGGKFSPDGYQAALASQGVSPAVFEEERRVAMEIEQLQDGLLDSAFYTPAEFRRFVVLEGERRQAAYAIIDAKALAAGVTVTDADIKAYYDAHPDRFESRESVSLDYVEAKPAEIPPAAEPTEAELHASYDANPDRFQTAEQRRARHILIAVAKGVDDAAAASKAADIRARLEKGEDFAALARQYSDDSGSAANGGELGWAGKGTYVGPFEEALFAARPGEITQPVKTEFGYHIIQLEEVRPGVRRSFDEVRSELAEEARHKGSQDRFFELTEKMDDAALQNPGSLEAVAKASGLPIRHVAEFTRSAGGEPFGANRAVIDAAFSGRVLEAGENSALVEVGDGSAVILRVTEHRPAKLRPLEEVRAQAEAGARAEQAASLAAERGRKLVQDARAGGDFRTLVAAAGTTLVAPSEPMQRNSPAVPAEVLAAIFRVPQPAMEPAAAGKTSAAASGSYDGLALQDGSYAVLRVDAVMPGRPDEIPREQRDARKAALARQTGIGEVTGVAVDLRKAAKVVVAPGLFDQQDNP
ncbi:Peptidyl-prolyl cis-trans isomerase D [Gammaproteobacteria bacterium]|nr:peptidyl-prolyl cis-trans isomerase [Gammaproteobacteria bacterium]CAG0939089.1 Peptidyl-prolyl cis-trans isomerase D [Gammaproteobacteria bacterium]